MKRIIISTFLFCLMSGAVEAAPEISAEYACVMEAETGEVIFEYNGEVEHSMASTTKIMTALVALENSSPDDMVTVSRNAAYQEGSSAYLAQNERIRMKDLLYGLMLNSGNDAAVAVAEHISGSESAFAEKMTERAKAIGAFNTSFKNPSGLDADGHYTTAIDLARITVEALKNPDFREIVSTSYKEVEYSGGILSFSNHNKLLKSYDGCIGVKTGFTKKTGRCLVSAAERDGITIVCVTLRAADDWNDHKKLLDFGFDSLSLTQVIKDGEVLSTVPLVSGGEIPVLAGEGVSLPLLQGGRRKTEIILHTIPHIDSSVEQGEKIGEFDVVYDGRKIKKIDLLAGKEYVKEKSLFESIIDFCKRIFA